MSSFKRPIPSTQHDILQDNLKAPQFEGFPVEGLPPDNRPPQKREQVNRGLITKREDDNTNNINIGLQDHDEAIAYYFDNVIKPSVVTNGERISVPLIYGNPERWKSVQRDGYYRDKEGKIQAPIIMFKRNNVIKRRDLGKKMDANNPQLHYVFQKKYTTKNQYDNFSVLQNREPQKEFHAVVIPDYVKLKYSFTIWTDYVAQMNKIVEAINYASDSYWGDPERFRIDSFSNKVETAQGIDRTIKTDFELELQGYIIPEAMNLELNNHPSKFFSKVTVTMSDHVVSNLDGPEKTRDDVREIS